MTKPTASAAEAFVLPNPIPPHPRLLAAKRDWERIRKQIQTDPVSAKIFAVLENKAKQALAEPPPKRELEGVRLLGVSRLVLDRVSALAMVACLTGEKAYADRAIQEMLAASKFSDWNPPHFLDTAEMSLALAIGYDWLYDQLDGTERKQIEQALLEKGLKPSIPKPEFAGNGDWRIRGNHTWWIAGTNNWNQVCHSGMTAAAIALADLQPELAAEVIRRAIENVPKAAQGYAPDGVYPEGPMYWCYGTSFHVTLAAALQEFSGQAHGLDTLPGFEQSALYRAQATSPTGLYFNSSDCSEKRGFDISLFWFVKRFHRPEWLRYDIDQLSIPSEKPYPGGRLLALALLWRDPTLVDDHKRNPPLNWLGRGINPIAVFRSAFSNRNALYVGLKGGSPSCSHAHMDAGSFVLEADGVRWAVDPGMQDYHSLESKGISLNDSGQDGVRWGVFRLGPEGHNILRFNSARQCVGGNGQFVRFQGNDDKQPHGVVNLTSIYADQAEAVHRGVMVLKNNNVLFQDEWTAKDKAVDVAWQMLTRAKVTRKSGKVVLEQDGKSLQLEILQPADAVIEVQSASELMNPFDAENPGMQRISVKTRTQAGNNGGFRILAVPGLSEPAAIPESRKLAAWSPAL